MNSKIDSTVVPNFDTHVDRSNSSSEKFESRGRIFGNETVQPLWVADMDLPIPPFLQDALVKRISHPCFGYTEQSSKLNESVKWWMKEEHQLEIDSLDILFSPSVATTFNNAIAAFSQEGDSVAIFSPVYGPFYFAIKNHKRNLVDSTLVLKDNDYFIDFEKFENLCDENRVKLLLLCNPQNPSGRVWSRSELEKLVAICIKRNIIILSDEIHSDIVFADSTHHSLLSIEGADEITVMAHSIGKTFNSSGLEASFLIIKNRKLRNQFKKVAELSHTSDINLIGKIAIETLFSPQGVEYKSALISYLTKMRDLVVSRLSKLNSINVMVPNSTFLVWLDFSPTGLTHDEIMKKLVDESEVGLGQGLFFGPAGYSWFRLNFAVAESKLIEAIEKIEKVFE
jgi:cystathionine beta-lyase